jgi:hypothetical protein
MAMRASFGRPLRGLPTRLALDLFLPMPDLRDVRAAILLTD